MNALSPAFPAGALANAGEARLCEMVFPEQANHYGTLFGGTALSLMGKAAFVAASRHARVMREGRTSMTVEVEMTAEGLTSGERALAVQGRFEMVCVDEAGKPSPIRPIR